MTKDTEFEHKVRLIFPEYNSHLETDEGKKVKIVSENQLEHMVRLCNIYGKSMRCVTDPNISAFKAVNLLLDYTTFNQIKKINVNTQKCKLEPGATFLALNRALSTYGFYVPYVVPRLNEDSDRITLDQAV